MADKKELLSQTIEHVDIKKHSAVPLVEAMQHMAYSARDLARAADIYDRMLRDSDCGVILCLAGSLVSAGLKQVFVDMVRNRMVDAIVSTGANIVDQDFFEALGFKHWIADEKLKSGLHDGELRDLMIDRIYDTLIDEDESDRRKTVPSLARVDGPRDLVVDGFPAKSVVQRYPVEGFERAVKSVFVAADTTLFVLVLNATPAEYDAIEPEFDALVESFIRTP